MSDLELKPINKFFRVTTSSNKFTKDINSDINSLHVYNNSPYKIILPVRFVEYCETNGTVFPAEERAIRVINILKLLDICKSTIGNEELSISNIANDSKRYRDFVLNLHFKFEIIQKKNKNFSQFSIFIILKESNKNLINY